MTSNFFYILQLGNLSNSQKYLSLIKENPLKTGIFCFKNGRIYKEVAPLKKAPLT
jgi:hypothetical protein